MAVAVAVEMQPAVVVQVVCITTHLSQSIPQLRMFKLAQAVTLVNADPVVVQVV